MNIDFYKYSGIGGRPVNEDSSLCMDNCFVVSDGLGGHDNGEIASGAAVNYIEDNFISDISDECISRLLIGADEAVRASGAGGKATVAAVFGNGELLRAANIGDSRVYYFRRGKVFFRTKDHSVCQASVDMGEMTDMDVRKSADRSGLFKVLGDTEPLKLPKLYDPIDPYDGDAFLICSDGFWENVYEPEMEADLLKSENSREWLTHMLKRHLLRARNSGDNFTAVCGMIHAPEKQLGTLPNTLDLSDGMTVDIPRTTEFSEAPKKLDGKKLTVIICAAVIIAASAVCVVMLPKLMGDKDPDHSVSSDISESVDPYRPPDPSSLPVLSDPNGPDDPVKPEDPTEPSVSGDPINPEVPTDPSVPGDPVKPEDPTDPSVPGDPINPEDPTDPSAPHIN